MPYSFRFPVRVWPVVVELSKGHGGRSCSRVCIFQHPSRSWCMRLAGLGVSIMTGC